MRWIRVQEESWGRGTIARCEAAAGVVKGLGGGGGEATMDGGPREWAACLLGGG